MYNFDVSLGRLTQQISKLLGRRLEEKFSSCGADITATHWSIISMIWQHHAQTQNHIGNFLVFDKVAIKRAIDQLEKMGLVERKKSNRDGRANIIRLTGKGEQIYKKLSPEAEQTLQEAFRQMNADQQQQLFAGLEQVYANLNQHRNIL